MRKISKIDFKNFPNRKKSMLIKAEFSGKG